MSYRARVVEPHGAEITREPTKLEWLLIHRFVDTWRGDAKTGSPVGDTPVEGVGLVWFTQLPSEVD